MKDSNKLNDPKGYEAVSASEKKFVNLYHSRIKDLQVETTGDYIIYTKISLPYAILNNFYVLETLFHPISISRHLSYDKPDLSTYQIIETLNNIIIYELLNLPEDSYLTQEQLVTTIAHFRGLERRRIG